MGRTMTCAADRTDRRDAGVFTLWCELTGHDPTAFDVLDVEAFSHRPEAIALANTPTAVLRDAGEAVRRGDSLPLERWLAAVRIVRPHR